MENVGSKWLEELLGNKNVKKDGIIFKSSGKLIRQKGGLGEEAMML